MYIDIEEENNQREVLTHIVNQIIVAILAGPHHTYNYVFHLLSGKEKEDFVCKYTESLDLFPSHFKNRLINMKEQVFKSAGILIIGMIPESTFLDVNCGLCGFESCQEFNSSKKEKIFCHLELMSFSGAIARGMTAASQMQVSNVLAHSLGVAAKKCDIIDAKTVFGIILDIGVTVKNARQNQMEVNTK
jgi:uncharacterized ferredoxin-like protein